MHTGITTPAPAKMALRAGSTIVFAFCIPDGLRHRLEFEEPIAVLHKEVEALATTSLGMANALGRVEPVSDARSDWFTRRLSTQAGDTLHG